MDLSLSKLREILKDTEAWCVAVHDVEKSRTWLSDWTTTLWAGFSAKLWSILYTISALQDLVCSGQNSTVASNIPALVHTPCIILKICDYDMRITPLIGSCRMAELRKGGYLLSLTESCTFTLKKRLKVGKGLNTRKVLYCWFWRWRETQGNGF